MIAIDDKSPSAANEIYSQMTTTARGKLIKSIAGPILFKSIHDRLMGEEIRPENKSKPEDIPSMLARNNIDLTKRTSVGNKVTFREALNNSMDNSFLPDLKAVRVDNKDQDELDKASARLNGLFRSNKKHGPEGLEVLAIYDTSITNGPEWDEFAAERSKNGEPNQYFETVWHGTGTVGGAMILRFGFKITPFDRATMAGRALGNGVYFAKFTDKSLQYLRDDTNRITRCVGNIGYLFEMEAQIGRAARKNSQPCGPDEGITCDHRSGGFPEATNHQDFISPEWAVFDPHAQVRIRRAYEVRIMDGAKIEALVKGKVTYQKLVAEEEETMSFKEFQLMEAEGGKEKHTATYIFADGMVPVGRGKRSLGRKPRSRVCKLKAASRASSFQ